MSDQNTEPTKRRTRRRTPPQPILLEEKILDLQDLLEKLKEMPLDDPGFEPLLNMLEGAGRTYIRMASLLKAERQLAAERTAGKSLAEASTRALKAMQREAKEARGGKKAQGEPEPP